MINDKVDYSQFPDLSIPVYYSTSKGYITYTGQIIPKHLQKKVYLMSPKRASEVLDLIPYQEYLNGDITKEDKFIHRDYGKKMNFSKLNRALIMSIKDNRGEDIYTLFTKLLQNYPYTITNKPENKSKSKNISKQDIEEDKYKHSPLGYRFDLDYD